MNMYTNYCMQLVALCIRDLETYLLIFSVYLSIFFSLNCVSLHFTIHFLLISTCTDDAAYEAVQKRTFFAMSISIGCIVIILFGMLIVYPNLIPKNKNREHDIDSDEAKSLLHTHSKNLSDSKYMP